MMLQEKVAEIEECLANRRWQNRCLWANVVTKSKTMEHNNYKIALCESNTLRTKREEGNAYQGPH